MADAANLTRIEVRSGFGEWKTAATSTTLDRPGDQDPIPACDRVKPGREFRFSSLGGLFAVSKDHPPSVAVTIRVHFFSECMANGVLQRVSLVTNPLPFDYAAIAQAGTIRKRVALCCAGTGSGWHYFAELPVRVSRQVR